MNTPIQVVVDNFFIETVRSCMSTFDTSNELKENATLTEAITAALRSECETVNELGKGLNDYIDRIHRLLTQLHPDLHRKFVDSLQVYNHRLYIVQYYWEIPFNVYSGLQNYIVE